MNTITSSFANNERTISHSSSRSESFGARRNSDPSKNALDSINVGYGAEKGKSLIGNLLNARKSADKPIPTVPERQWQMHEVFEPAEISWIAKIEQQQKQIPVPEVSKAEIENLVQKNYGAGAAEKAKILHLVVGPPGAGKSSVLVDPLAEKHKAMVIDSDSIKPQIKNYEKGLGTNAVHPASAQVANTMLVRALNNGENIVHPIIGRNEADLTKLIRTAKNKGYRVGLHLANVPPEVSARRVYNRARKGNDGVVQMVSPNYAMNVVGNLPERVFSSVIKKPGLADEYSHYNTNVPWGTKPELLAFQA